jgi:hypothetical protein
MHNGGACQMRQDAKMCAETPIFGNGRVGEFMACVRLRVRLMQHLQQTHLWQKK